MVYLGKLLGNGTFLNWSADDTCILHERVCEVNRAGVRDLIDIFRCLRSCSKRSA